MESIEESNHFLMCTPQLGHSEMFMDLYTEKRRGRKETEVARRIKRGNEKERDRSKQYSLFSNVWNTQKFTELHGVEKREEGVRGDPNEMRWNQ